MANFPAAGHISDGDRTKVEVKSDLEATIAAAKQSLGGISESAPVIASGVITPEVPILKVRTESAAATDNLDNIAVTNFHGGAMIVLSAYSASEVVTIRNAQGGSGQIKTADGANIVLDDIATHVLLALNGTDWEEKGRFSPRLPFAHTATKTGAYTVTLTDRGKVFLCTASSGWALGLPAPATAGAGFCIAVKKTDANTNAITLTPASGNIEGAATYVIDSQNESVIVVCDGTAYYVITATASSSDQKIIQVEQGTYSSSTEISVGSPTTTNIVAAITPSSSSNKIRATVSMSVQVIVTSGTVNGRFSVYRGSTALMTPLYLTTAATITIPVNFECPLDSPSSTSEQTYTVKAYVEGSGLIRTCAGNTTGVLTLEEVSA